MQQTQILVGYHATKDEDDKDIVQIFAMQRGCPPFWSRNLYGSKEISARDLAKDAETQIMANQQQFLNDPDRFLPRDFGKQMKKE